MGEISVKTGNNARNGGKNSLNRLIRCVCGKKIGPDPRNFNQRVSLGRNDLLIRTFPYSKAKVTFTTANTMTGQSDLLKNTKETEIGGATGVGVRILDSQSGEVTLGTPVVITFNNTNSYQELNFKARMESPSKDATPGNVYAQADYKIAYE
ncbi:fimbrial-like protein [Escherichia coli]|nr:fimbrial-like protein [Escherichia coli]